LAYFSSTSELKLRLYLHFGHVVLPVTVKRMAARPSISHLVIFEEALFVFRKKLIYRSCRGDNRQISQIGLQNTLKRPVVFPTLSGLPGRMRNVLQEGSPRRSQVGVERAQTQRGGLRCGHRSTVTHPFE
jgi:hypothetical protein